MRTPKKSPIDLYQVVTDQIIAKLREGIIPWKQGYFTELARNYVTGKAYRGINAVLLGMTGHERPYFLTYKQAQEFGGNVRKGAKSEIAVYYQMRYFDPIKNQWLSKTDATLLPAGCKVIPLLKYYRVFNIEDVEGIDFSLEQRPILTDDLLLDDLEIGYQPARALPGLQLKMNYPMGCYQPMLDTICMPSLQNFYKVSGYFKTLYHELIHATGHENRLARPGITHLTEFGDHAYSKEELIAELGSCFLLSIKGFDSEEQMQNSAAYLEYWLQAFQSDKKLIFEAAAEAQKAVDYILERQQVSL